jgi:hypothetical protein
MSPKFNRDESVKCLMCGWEGKYRDAHYDRIIFESVISYSYQCPICKSDLAHYTESKLDSPLPEGQPIVIEEKSGSEERTHHNKAVDDSELENIYDKENL